MAQRAELAQYSRATEATDRPLQPILDPTSARILLQTGETYSIKSGSNKLQYPPSHPGA